MIADLPAKAKFLLTENSSAILTAAGVVGTVGTAVLTGRASFKAASVIADKKAKEVKEAEVLGTEAEFTKKDAAFTAFPLFIPPVVVGAGTIAAIVMANRISAKKAAALAAAYGIADSQLDEYKQKVLEKFGANKEQEIVDEVAQDRVNKNENHQVIIVGSGDVLCYDALTGRYFQSSVEKVTKAMAQIHSEIYNHMYVSLSTFFDELGLPPTDLTEEVGWNSSEIPEVKFSTTRTPDDRPCLVLQFTARPKPDYARLYD